MPHASTGGWSDWKVVAVKCLQIPAASMPKPCDTLKAVQEGSTRLHIETGAAQRSGSILLQRRVPHTDCLLP